MARFFIDRPIFAFVIAIVLMLAGGLAITSLPVAQYPAIAPPTIAITAIYPGASAKTLEDTVTQVIEQKLNGIDHLRYLSSASDSSGTVVITITFDANTDPDIAQVQVQNKLQLALPLLPPEVQRLGVGVAKSVSNFLMFAAFVSTDGSLDASALGDYVASSVQEQISRVPGVGDVSLFGAQYAMRIWLNPDQLASYQLTAAEVTNAVQAQNAQVSAGQLGGLPAVPGQQLNATITAQTRLQNAEEFGDILLRVNQDGSRVRLRDVARIELDGENFVNFAELNGKPVAALGIKLTTGANALDTANRVKGRIKELSAFFPSGLNVEYPYETTPFVRLSIEEVVKTLIEAIALVFVVMFLFLQSFRATLIPTIAVPVVLLGTFGVLAAAGFTINTLTMFAMVLAIGLLVDDAIVVVENVERVMSEEGLPPKEATRKSMDQITGALVGIAMVLAAVFVPMAFFGGSVGVIYRQFSITLVSAMALSVLVAIILTPALCVTLLKPSAKGHGAPRPGFFGWFNRTYDRGSARYQIGVRWMLQRGGRTLLVYAAIVAALAVLFVRLPGGFLPDEDQGNIFLQVQLPPGATMESTADVLRQLSTYLLEQEADAVESVVVVRGFNFSGRGQNAGLGFVKLKDWNVRKSPRLKAAAVARRAMGAFSKLKGAVVFAFTPPAVQELGNASGFDLELLDRGGAGHAKLIEARNQLLGLAARSPVLAKVRPNGLEDTPDYRIDVDRQKASALGLSLGDVNRNLSATWGSAYVNDFIDRGRVKKVYLQADAPYRMQPQDVDRWYVRNAQGGMVPFSAFSSGRWTYGSPKLERYNGVPSVEILGEPAPGKSTGEAMDEIEKLMKQLPAGIGHAWTGLSYEERLAGSGTTMLYVISLLVVFLCLSALYESWSIPIAVLLVVPLGVIGAVAATGLRAFSNDVYFQVALLTTIGLSAKNAILIVEFAKEQHEAGKSLFDAALEAARLRLRPILMTSLAFILGVMPLAISNGAGSGSQNALGTAVIGGMLTATVLAVFFVPVFFVVVRRFASRAKAAEPALAVLSANG